MKYFLKLLRCLWSSHNIPISLKSCCYSPTLIFLLLLPHPFSGVVNCYVGYLKIYMNIFHDTTNYSWINSKLFAWHHFYFENLSEKLGLIEFIHVEIWFRKDYLVSIQIEMLQPFKIINWGHIFPNTMVKSENKLFGLSLGNFRCFHWLYHLSKINDTKIESPIPNEVKSSGQASMSWKKTFSKWKIICFAMIS